MVAFDVHERRWVEVLRIDDGTAGVGEDLEAAADANIVAVAGHAVGDDAGAGGAVGERVDFDVLFDEPIGEYAHAESLQKPGACAPRFANLFTIAAANGWHANPAPAVKFERISCNEMEHYHNI